jgi:asparagine synthase (glutamine-hydrolysing)
VCGIAGIVQDDHTGLDAALLQSLCYTLRHRGPDDVGFLGWNGTSSVQVSLRPDAVQGSWTALVHRRLAILDLGETGWQPMSTPDGRYHIVFNGEIYNYLELRAELEGVGYMFRSHSDTEVLLIAYAHWGYQALTRLVGMFAFVILDTRARTLCLARDFFGIKPLYYTYGPHSFTFASEIKALLELPWVSRGVHPQRLYDYLRFGLTDHGEDTLFADIRQIPAAHYLEIPVDCPRRGRLMRYWQVDLRQHLDISFEDAAVRLRDLFLENVKLHLRSDVPVGAALSGGIDSSAIVLAMRYLQGRHLELHTFSYIADEAGLNEEGWVDMVSQAGQSVAHKVHLDPQATAAGLDRLIALQDEPFGSTSIYAQMQVFRLAQEAGVKVMLDGQGADELFGGYRPHLAARLASLLRQGQWGEARRFLAQAARLPGAGHRMLLSRALGVLACAGQYAAPRWILAKYLFPPWLNAAWFASHGVVSRPIWHAQEREVLREHLFQALVDNSLPMLLRYEDRNSMAFSIESRTPFLTPALVNFVFSLPEDYIIAADGTSKAVFRRAMRGLVPDPILDRRDKIGFATPATCWLPMLRPWVDKVLQSEVAHALPALHLDVVRQQWQVMLAGQRPTDFRVWRWLNILCWAERFQVNFTH